MIIKYSEYIDLLIKYYIILYKGHELDHSVQFSGNRLGCLAFVNGG